MSAKPIRFGGRMTASGFRFELSGGHPALDFANTLDERLGSPPRELLQRYGDLLQWGRQCGVLDAGAARALARAAVADPAAAARVLGRAVALRETIFRLFHRFSTNHVLDEPSLRAVEAAATNAFRHRRIARARGRVEWVWDERDPASILWRIAAAAASLLTSPDLARVRTCDGHNCLWLFLDTSRRGNRRWCDMTVCGNRAKARRSYARTREADDAGRHLSHDSRVATAREAVMKKVTRPKKP